MMISMIAPNNFLNSHPCKDRYNRVSFQGM
jgi:hypothetical protein